LSISRKIDSVLIFTRHLTRMPCLWGYLDDLVSLCEKATKMAFSLEETPCESTGFFSIEYVWFKDCGQRRDPEGTPSVQRS